jgi:flagellar basal body-associated protein FliL
MAEKAEKKPDAAPPADKKEAPKAGGGIFTKLPVLLGGVMLIEAVVLFAGFKFLAGGPKNANAADLTTDIKKDGGEGADAAGPNADKPKTVEIKLLDARFPNKLSGREFLYDVSIFVSVKADSEDKVKKLIEGNDALIQDRVRTIIAQSDPEKLGGGSEPGLETLRRQVKFQLDEIVGENMIDEVLVPRCIPFRADY